MLMMPGFVAAPMGQKLPLVGFGPCRRAVPSWMEKVVLVASVGASPGCGVVSGVPPYVAALRMAEHPQRTARPGPPPTALRFVSADTEAPTAIPRSAKNFFALCAKNFSLHSELRSALRLGNMAL